MAITVICQGLPAPVPAQIGIEPEHSGLTLRSLILDHLSSQSEPGLVEALFDDQGLKPGYTILVNGRNAMQLGGLDLVIADGSSVLITALVAGG
jgi:molybdopterin converting factor small subunit